MASTFTIGETVICSITVKDASGALQDPATSMKITVDQIKPSYTANKLAITDMAKDSTGTYHYDVSTSAFSQGTYKVIYTATDGTRVTIHTDSFELKIAANS